MEFDVILTQLLEVKVSDLEYEMSLKIKGIAINLKIDVFGKTIIEILDEINLVLHNNGAY